MKVEGEIRGSKRSAETNGSRHWRGLVRMRSGKVLDLAIR